MPRSSAAAAIIPLFLSIGETRLYHDRFNFFRYASSFEAVPVWESGIRRHTWIWIVCGALAAIAVVWVAWSRLASHHFDWGLALRSLERLHWGWLVVSLGPIAGTYYGRALRWAVFLKPLKDRPSLSNLFSATVIGFAAISVFGRPGEFVRPYLIAVKERVSVPSQMAAWLLERMFDLLMALLFFAFALTRVTAVGLHSGSKLAAILAVGGQVVGFGSIGLLVLILGMRHFAQPVQRLTLSALRFLPEKQFRWAEKLIGAFVEGVASTRSDAALALVLVYSVLEWVLIACCYWCLSQSFSGILNLTFVDIIVFLGFVSFGAAIQIPGIGGGVQVVAIAVLTELFGVRLEIASLFALLIWLFTFVAIIPAGAVMALKEGLDWRGLRRIGQQAST